jgi:L-iditol 2-dehydrogenase
MKVACKGEQNIIVCEKELRSLKSDEIRLKVEACGICGSDLQNEPEQADTISGFGHEMAGTILELGGHNEYSMGLRIGQKVVIESATPCGRCTNCRNARQELCTDIQTFFNLGYFGFAEETIVPAISAIVCDDLKPDIACLSEPLGVAIDMVRLADIQVGSNVLIMGPGPIGLMALALVKRAGARRVFVSGFKKRSARVELSHRFGSDAFIDPSRTPLKQFDFSCDIDRIIVTSPPRTLPDAFHIAAKGAIISFIGIGTGEAAFCTFNVNDFHFKKLQLRASYASPALYTPLALQYLREGVVNGEALISHRFSLDQIAEAMEVAKNDPTAVKVIIEP